MYITPIPSIIDIYKRSNMNILATYKLDTHTQFVILEYNKHFNTIKSAFLTENGLDGIKDTSIHYEHNEYLNSVRPYIIRLMHRYYLDNMEWGR